MSNTQPIQGEQLNNNSNEMQQRRQEEQQDQQYQDDSPSMEFQLNMQQEPNIDFLNGAGNNNQNEDTNRWGRTEHSLSQTSNHQDLFKQFTDKKQQQQRRQGQHNLVTNNIEFTMERVIEQTNAQRKSSTQQTILTTKTQSKQSTHITPQSQFESEQKLYQQYQHDQNNNSSSSQSESSIDTEASFAKMNARRTMLLSDDFYGTNQYSTITNQLSTEQCKVVQQCSRKIAHLQSLIKRESILLQFEQKTKSERIKQIEYCYVNAFNNFLCLNNLRSRSMESNPILLNSKDLFQIHEDFLDDLRRVKDVMGKVLFCGEGDNQGEYLKRISSSRRISNNNQISQHSHTLKSLFSLQLQPPQSFLTDFNNFFPSWSDNIRQLMQMEFQSHHKIENTFQSQYTIASKILSSLKYRDNIRRFCQSIFKQPISQLREVKQQLIVDFSIIYQKWSSNLFNMPNSNQFKQFMQGKFVLEQGAARGAIVQDVAKFFGEKMDQSEYEKLLIELNHFAKNRNAMNFLFSEIGREQIEGEQINLRLALLVYKKIQINRRKLQQLSLLFINQIIDNYQDTPIEIKYVVQLFKQLAKKKAQQQGQQPTIKYQDLKSFFNKIVFSQLYFSTFMQLLDDKQQPSSSSSTLAKKTQTIKSFSQSHQSHNMTMMALISQKIMFGQQFYQKFKYGYFNTVIKQYTPKIKTFIQNFAQNEVIRFEEKREIQCMLVSLQSVKFLYGALRKNGLIKELVSFQHRLMKCGANQPFSLGSSKYTQQKMYTMIVYKPQLNYTSIFRPREKLRRSLIQFLSMIESINEGVTFREVLEQYKCMQEDHLQIAKPSIQIYANYLSSLEQVIEMENIAEEIEENIRMTKQYIEKVKISLEREHNLSMNLEHMYQSLLMQTKKSLSKETLQGYVNLLFNLPLQFDYYVIDNKICQSENNSPKKKQRIIKDCLNDVAQFFGKGLQGLDGLYSLLLEKITQQISRQGINDQNIIQTAQTIIGEKLHKMINLNSVQSQKDKKLYNSMKRHKFLNVTMLTLPQYSDQEEIILQLCLEILQRLKHPMSPDKMIQCFNEVTLVFQNVITCVGKASDITSDVQIPLMELVLVKSMIPNLNTILEFIKTFSHNDSGSNKYGMILALVESICYLIENMDAQHLGISEQQYVRYIQDQYMIVE